MVLSRVERCGEEREKKEKEEKGEKEEKAHPSGGAPIGASAASATQGDGRPAVPHHRHLRVAVHHPGAPATLERGKVGLMSWFITR